MSLTLPMPAPIVPAGNFPIVYVEDIEDRLGVKITDLFRHQTNMSLTDVVYWSSGGDDANDGLESDRAVESFAKAKSLATGASSRTIIVPDASQLTIPTGELTTPIKIVAIHGARIRAGWHDPADATVAGGKFTVRGTWIVHELGEDGDLVTLGADSWCYAVRTYADLKTEDATHLRTFMACPWVHGGVALAGSGNVFLQLGITSGVIPSNTNKTLSPTIHGRINNMAYGFDWAHYEASFQTVDAQSITTGDIDVTGKATIPGLQSRIDQVAQRNAENSGLEHHSPAIPAAQHIPARSPIVIASTPAGGRFYSARDRVLREDPSKRDIYGLSEIDGTIITDAATTVDFVENSSSHSDGTPSITSNERWTVVVYSEGSKLRVRVGDSRRAPVRGADLSDAAEIDVGSVAEIDVALIGTHEALVMWLTSWDSEPEYATVKIASDGSPSLDASNTLPSPLARTFKIVYSPRLDCLVVAIISGSTKYAALYAFDIDRPTQLNGLSTNDLRRHSGAWQQHGYDGRATGGNIGLEMHGDDIVLILDMAIGTMDVWLVRLTDQLHFVDPVSASGVHYSKATPLQSPSNWGCSSDGQEILLIGAGGPGAVRSYHVTRLSSSVRVAESGDTTSAIGAFTERARACWSAVAECYEVVWVRNRTTLPDTIGKSQYFGTQPATSGEDPIGVTRSETRAGQTPDYARDGEEVDGFAALSPGQVYYLDPVTGRVSRNLTGQSVYRSLSTSMAAVVLYDRHDQIDGNSQDIGLLQSELGKIRSHQLGMPAARLITDHQPFLLASGGVWPAKTMPATTKVQRRTDVYDSSAQADPDIPSAYLDQDFPGTGNVDIDSVGWDIGPDGAALFYAEHDNYRIHCQWWPLSKLLGSTDSYRRSASPKKAHLELPDKAKILFMCFRWTGARRGVLLYVVETSGSVHSLFGYNIAFPDGADPVFVSPRLTFSRFRAVEHIQLIWEGTSSALWLGVATMGHADLEFSSLDVEARSGSEYGKLRSSRELSSRTLTLKSGSDRSTTGWSLYRGSMTTPGLAVLVGSSDGKTDVAYVIFTSGRSFVSRTYHALGKDHTGGQIESDEFTRPEVVGFLTLVSLGSRAIELAASLDAIKSAPVNSLQINTSAISGYAHVGTTSSLQLKNAVEESGSTPSIDWIAGAVNSQTGGIEVVILKNSRVWKADFLLAHVATDHNKAFGLARGEWQVGQSVEWWVPGSVISGLSGLTPGDVYYVHADGSVDSTRGGDGVSIYKSLTSSHAYGTIDLSKI